jgi:hypothetical protein
MIGRCTGTHACNAMHGVHRSVLSIGPSQVTSDRTRIPESSLTSELVLVCTVRPAVFIPMHRFLAVPVLDFFPPSSRECRGSPIPYSLASLSTSGVVCKTSVCTREKAPHDVRCGFPLVCRVQTNVLLFRILMTTCCVLSGQMLSLRDKKWVPRRCNTREKFGKG